MADNSTPLGAIIGLLGAISALSLIPRWLGRPTYGPRLLPGELRASDASSQASRAYWAAEEAASRGNCKTAEKAWIVGEKFRAEAEERTARGDETGRDLRSAIRGARDELRRCK